MILDGFLFAVGATLGVFVTYVLLGTIYEMYSDWSFKRYIDRKNKKK